MASNFEEQRNNQNNFGGGCMPDAQGLGSLLNPQVMTDPGPSPSPLMKGFATGATRSADDGKNDYEGFLSFPVIEEFGDYMTRHRVQPDGNLRESDNWQKGIPIVSYIKSLVRHALELWGLHRGHVSKRLQKEYPFRSKDMDFLKRETACACLFNIQGFLHETLRKPDYSAQTQELLDVVNQWKARDQAATEEIFKAQTQGSFGISK
jgi:hypothetical protein